MTPSPTNESSEQLRLYTVAMLAKELKISERTVRRWISSGELEHLRFGRSVRVSRSQIDAFLKIHITLNNQQLTE